MTSFGNLVELLDATCDDDPDHVLIVDPVGGRLTKIELARRSLACAGSLRRAGIARGDAVGLLFDPVSILEHAVAYYATLRVGAAAVPLDAATSAYRIEVLRERYGLAALLGASHAAPVDHPEVVPVSELPPAHAGDPVATPLDPTDVAAILETSGTTGEPLGVRIPHGNLAVNLFLKQDLRQERYLAPFPLNTNAGHNILADILKHRRRTYVVPGSFDVASLADLVTSESITDIKLVPMLARRLAEHLAESGRESPLVERIGLTSAATDKPTLRALRAAFPAAEVTNGYSSTEAWPASTMRTFDEDSLLSVGWPTDGSEVAIQREDGSIGVQPGVEGKVLLRRPGHPTRSYVDEVADDATTFLPGGWTVTGDVGKVGPSGDLILTGRAKEALNVGGRMLAPLELELVLRECPGVADAAVIGLPHPSLGDSITAVVVVDDPNIDDATVAGFIRQRLGQRFVPHQIVRRPELPRNTIGKIEKRNLKESILVRDASTPEPAPPEKAGALAEVLEGLWRQVLYMDAQPAAGTNFFLEGGDSLSRTRVPRRGWGPGHGPVGG